MLYATVRKNLGVVRCVSEIQGAELGNFGVCQLHQIFSLVGGPIANIFYPLYVLVLELPGGRTFDFFAENF